MESKIIGKIILSILLLIVLIVSILLSSALTEFIVTGHNIDLKNKNYCKSNGYEKFHYINNGETSMKTSYIKCCKHVIIQENLGYSEEEKCSGIIKLVN